MPIYNHAYTIAFSLLSNSESGHVSGAQLRDAIQARLENCSDAELEEACGAPFDTYKEDHMYTLLQDAV